MSDARKSDPKRPAVVGLEDEPVIDLVDEVPGGPADGDLSALEKNLLDLERGFGRGLEKTDEDRRTFPQLPDLNQLNGFDFEEDDAEPPASAPLPPAAAKEPLPGVMEPELDWLLEEAAAAPAEVPAGAAGAADNAITEISEFDEQFLEAEEIMDGPPAAAEASEAGNDEETLELLDLDEHDNDNQLVWFDDFDKPQDRGAEAPAGPAGVPPPESTDARPSANAPAADTTAMDLFEAFVQSGRPVADAAFVTAEPSAAAAASPAARPDTAAPSPFRTADLAQPPAANALTEDQIEAAVERVIARMHAGTIETIIRQAIEKAVSKEIERLKNRLLESDPDDKVP